MDKYVEAMKRKLDIAEYHLAVLRELLPFAKPDDRNLPPVALQAHFEACSRAIVAIPDQLVSGIAFTVSGMPEVRRATPNKVIKRLSSSVHPKAAELESLITDLNDDCRINDLRDIRNRSTHRFDEKRYLAGKGWFVNPPEFVPQCEDSRQLGEYLQAMVEYAEEVIVAVSEVRELVAALANGSDA